MTLRQLIRQYIKEGLEKQLNRKNSMKYQYLNENEEDDTEYDSDADIDYKREVDSRVWASLYPDRSPLYDEEYEEEDDDADAAIRFYEKDGWMTPSNDRFEVNHIPSLISIKLFDEDGFFKVDMKYINKHIKPMASVMKQFIIEIEKLSSLEIKNAKDLENAIKSLVSKNGRNRVEDYMDTALSFLKNDNLTLYTKLRKEYSKALYEGMHFFERDIDWTYIENERFHEANGRYWDDPPSSY